MRASTANGANIRSNHALPRSCGRLHCTPASVRSNPLLDRVLPLARPCSLELIAAVDGAGGPGSDARPAAYGALAAHAGARFLDPASLLLLWIAYPLVKGAHELGHALTIQRWGQRYRNSA